MPATGDVKLALEKLTSPEFAKSLAKRLEAAGELWTEAQVCAKGRLTGEPSEVDWRLPPDQFVGTDMLPRTPSDDACAPAPRVFFPRRECSIVDCLFACGFAYSEYVERQMARRAS